MRFQDSNGLLQGRIHDGVMRVLLHQVIVHAAAGMSPWTLLSKSPYCY